MLAPISEALEKAKCRPMKQDEVIDANDSTRNIAVTHQDLSTSNGVESFTAG